MGWWSRTLHPNQRTRADEGAAAYAAAKTREAAEKENQATAAREVE